MIIEKQEEDDQTKDAYAQAKSIFNDIDLSRIPAHMHDGIEAYIMNGIPPGGFLVSLFSNKLLESYQSADDSNRHAIAQYAELLYDIPSVSCGSAENVARWIDHGGLIGYIMNPKVGIRE